MLETRNATLAYDAAVIAEGLTVRVPEGQVTAVVGANGSGKSTLLRALARVLTPTAGDVVLDGRPIGQWPTNDVARRLAMLPQAPHAPGGLTVRDLVGFGRFPYRRWFGGPSERDVAAVDRALADVDLTDLAARPVADLSGGQRQRVWIAMALAQETRYVLLDEPTTYLDLAHQLDVMDLIARLRAEFGKTVVMVVHDLNLAARYAGHVIAMADGAVIAAGRPADVLTPATLRRVFGIEARVVRDDADGSFVCIPVRAVPATA